MSFYVCFLALSVPDTVKVKLFYFFRSGPSCSQPDSVAIDDETYGVKPALVLFHTIGTER